MTIASKPVSAEELLAMDNKRLELYEGELRTVSPANFQHARIAVRIASILLQYVQSRQLGDVLVEMGCVLKRNPDTVLGPDVAFIRQSRLPAKEQLEKFFEGAPDLAIEIISPSNPRREREEKLQTYIRFGTPLGWLIDPRAETIEIYKPNLPLQRLSKGDRIVGDEVLPGFSCSTAEFFA